MGRFADMPTERSRQFAFYFLNIPKHLASFQGNNRHWPCYLGVGIANAHRKTHRPQPLQPAGMRRHPTTSPPRTRNSPPDLPWIYPKPNNPNPLPRNWLRSVRNLDASPQPLSRSAANRMLVSGASPPSTPRVSAPPVPPNSPPTGPHAPCNLNNQNLLPHSQLRSIKNSHAPFQALPKSGWLQAREVFVCAR